MAERQRGLHIDTLRVRLPARDARAGQRAALDLVHDLAERSPELLALAPRGVSVGALHMRVPAPGARNGEGRGVAGSVTSALGRAVTRAGRGSSKG
jgi:hypothetical protein